MIQYCKFSLFLLSAICMHILLNKQQGQGKGVSTVVWTIYDVVGVIKPSKRKRLIDVGTSSQLIHCHLPSFYDKVGETVRDADITKDSLERNLMH